MPRLPGASQGEEIDPERWGTRRITGYIKGSLRGRKGNTGQESRSSAGQKRKLKEEPLP